MLQGCPLSGIVFVLVLDPFLRAMGELLDMSGVSLTRACADDVGAAVSNIVAPKRYHSIFKILEKVAALKVKPKKCVIVPIATTFSMHVVSVVRDWLVGNVPEWGAMSIAKSGRYLGFEMGPAVLEDSWSGPLAKWARRGAAIQCAGLAPSLGIFNYNARVEPVLGYVAQVAPPPDRLRRLELHAAHRVLHSPGCVLPLPALTRLRMIGLPNFRSASASCFAALVRTAVGGAIEWEEQWQWMSAVAEDVVPIARNAEGMVWAPHWRSPAMAANLRAAAEGRLVGSTPRRTARALGAAVEAAREAVQAGSRRRVQSSAYSAFVDALGEIDMGMMMIKKFNRLFSVQWSALFGARLVASMASVPPQAAAHALRFVTNAWPTTARLHVEVEPCAF